VFLETRGKHITILAALVADIALFSVVQVDIVDECRDPWITCMSLVIENIPDSTFSPILHHSFIGVFAKTSRHRTHD
jgi:hypothetical protein